MAIKHVVTKGLGFTQPEFLVTQGYGFSATPITAMRMPNRLWIGIRIAI